MSDTMEQQTEHHAPPLASRPRRLGRSGLSVPAIGLGGAALGGSYGEVSEAEAVGIIHDAIGRGINFIDTDASYGHSEYRVGLALQGGLRDKVILSTKIGTHPERNHDYSRDGTLWNVDASLRALHTDHLELLLVHDPPDIEPVLARGGALEALHSLKEQGVVRAIGLGLRGHEFHRRGIATGLVDVILTFADYNPIRTTAEPLLQLAARHDVGVLNGAPLAMGLLTGEDPDTIPRNERGGFPERDMEAARRLYRWCNQRRLSVKALAFQFSLRQPMIHSTPTGVKSRAELAENLHATETSMPETVWEELAALDLTRGQE